MFAESIARWNLTPAGEPMRSRSSALLPVMWRDVPAMLKIALIDEERRGADLMELWGGQGAALVFARKGDALLMERATGDRSLTAMSGSGEDDEATRIICSAVNRIHETQIVALPNLVALERWFESLAAVGARGLFADSARAAADLLAHERPEDVVMLHGDIHHGNILDFGPRGWLAIDPKGLVGDRAYDFANLFCNPDESAADPLRFDRRLAIVSEAARIDRERLLKWILAWAGLSAAFSLEDGETPDKALEIARLASGRLR
jgi:streptomycin 6-kinase